MEPTKFEVLRRCFYLGKAYDKGDEMELNHEHVVHNYRIMGYIGAEIPTPKRKGRRVRQNGDSTD